MVALRTSCRMMHLMTVGQVVGRWRLCRSAVNWRLPGDADREESCWKAVSVRIRCR